MRNRKVQREVRRMIGKEEKLDLIDYCGAKDPTPFEAVKNMIRKERSKVIILARDAVKKQNAAIV